jgi:protein O-GlcNAc transferase
LDALILISSNYSVLWTGTPVLTWPKHRLKMSSRVCASIVNATGFGSRMITSSLSEYEERAVSLASTLSYTFNADLSERRGEGELIRLRRDIFLNLDRMPLFDTVRWTRNVEKGFEEVWKRWVDGSEFEREERGAIELHDDQPFFPT